VQGSAFLLFPFCQFDVKQKEAFSAPDHVVGSWLYFSLQFGAFLIGLLMINEYCLRYSANRFYLPISHNG